MQFFFENFEGGFGGLRDVGFQDAAYIVVPSGHSSSQGSRDAFDVSIRICSCYIWRGGSQDS